MHPCGVGVALMSVTVCSGEVDVASIGWHCMYWWGWCGSNGMAMCVLNVCMYLCHHINPNDHTSSSSLFLVGVQDI